MVDSRNPNHLLVGAWVIDHPDGGLFVSNDSGHTWINQAEMRGQSVRAVAAAPSDPTVFVAGSLQGVFRSTDAGQHWNRISPADSTEIHEIESVAIDPKDPNVIYAGTWHLPWKTTDAGQHWNTMKQGIIDDSDVFSIIVDPTSPQTVYASACSGIYKSEDAGTLFLKVEGIPKTARRTRVLLQDPHQRDTIFAGTTEGLYRSIDAGKTWSRTTGPEIIVNDVSVDLADSRQVLIATDRGGVLASRDGGDTFSSSNGGFSTRQITALKQDDRHSQTLFVGVVNDKDWGGVFVSENGGVNWIQRSDGLQGRDVFSLGQAPDGTMIAGTSHGIYRLDSIVKSWQRVEGAPVVAPDPVRGLLPSSNLTRSPVLVHSSPARHNTPTQHTIRNPSRPQSPGHSIASSHNATATKRPPLASSRGAIPDRGTSSTAARRHTASLRSAPPMQVAPKVSSRLPPEASQTRFEGAVYSLVTSGWNVLAVTSSGLLTSADNGQTWSAPGPVESLDWRLLASAKSNVIAASRRELQFSSDSGASWSPVSLPRQLTQISALAVEPSGEIWVGGREGVFVSSGARNVWSTPKNLYDNSVNSIFYDEASRSVTITSGQGIVFTIQLPQRSVAYYESGWSLRFARPLGDHLVGATLFDGLVLQPKMMVFPVAEWSHPSATSAAP